MDFKRAAIVPPNTSLLSYMDQEQLKTSAQPSSSTKAMTPPGTREAAAAQQHGTQRAGSSQQETSPTREPLLTSDETCSAGTRSTAFILSPLQSKELFWVAQQLEIHVSSCKASLLIICRTSLQPTGLRKARKATNYTNFPQLW